MDSGINDACETIDAAMFSGDVFEDGSEREALLEYIDKWIRELKKYEANRPFPCRSINECLFLDNPKLCPAKCIRQ